MPSLWLSKPAFISLVTSGIEVYKKESFGLLFGSRRNGNYFVKYAVNIQSAKRHYDSITIDKSRIRRINDTASGIMKHKFIGDFHSHADGPAKLSKTDVKELREMGPKTVSVLVVVHRKKGEKWKHDADRSICGPVGKYFVRIIAFEIRHGKLEKLKIRCPYLWNVNRMGR